MLEIGQDVFVVCKVWTSKDPENHRSRFYISKKQIASINYQKYLTTYLTTYRAGKNSELEFRENEDGTFRSINRVRKPVFLDYESAVVERDRLMAEELAIRNRKAEEKGDDKFEEIPSISVDDQAEEVL